MRVCITCVVSRVWYHVITCHSWLPMGSYSYIGKKSREKKERNFSCKTRPFKNLVSVEKYKIYISARVFMAFQTINFV